MASSPKAVWKSGLPIVLNAKRFSFQAAGDTFGLQLMSGEMEKRKSGEPTTLKGAFPVLILGSINDVDVGFRQLRRKTPIETKMIATAAGRLAIPTWDEMLCMKAFLAYDRNATRDYLDFAALSACETPEAVLASLQKLDARYGEMQTASVALEVAKALSAAAPFDLNESELPNYKGISGKWQLWETTRAICCQFGSLLGEALIRGGK